MANARFSSPAQSGFLTDDQEMISTSEHASSFNIRAPNWRKAGVQRGYFDVYIESARRRVIPPSFFLGPLQDRHPSNLSD